MRILFDRKKIAMKKQTSGRKFLGTFAPKLAELNDDVFTPVWWYTYAPAVATFLSEYDLSGKTIIPFVTNGGWIGHTLKDIENSCKNAIVANAIDIRFNIDKMIFSESNLKKWIAYL